MNNEKILYYLGILENGALNYYQAIEFTNKNWGSWCSNHCKYMTELQSILKEVSE